MAQISGKLGAIDGVPTARNWRVSHSDDGPTFNASGMEGLQGSVAGNKDWTGSTDVYGHTPSLLPGADFTFAGYNGAKRWYGAAVVESFNLSCDIEAGGIISHTISFAGNGALAVDGTAVTDSDPPEVYSSLGCKVTTDDNDDGTYAEMVNVASYTLNMQSSLEVYSDSSTSGIKKRKAGIISGTASVVVNESDLSALPTPGTITKLRLYVSATEYWQVAYVKVKSVEQSPDIEGGGIIKSTINYEYTGYKRVSGTMTRGGLVTPGLVGFAWPS